MPVERPSAALTRHALRGLLRRPMAAFFILVFPLSFFVIINAIVGDAAASADGAVRVSQYLVSPFAVFGAAEAAFCVLAIDLAVLRENGVLKRLRSTPVSPATLLGARVAAAVVIAGVPAVLLTGVGAALYDVQIVWRKVPAALVTLVLGVACSAALGLCAVALTRSVLATQALTNGVLVPLGFISNVFLVGTDLPRPLDLLGRALPLRHFADALAATFDPVAPGAGFRPGDLGMLAVWGLAGGLLAAWRFGWEPRLGRRGTASAPAVVAPVVRRLGAARTVPQPGAWRYVGVQARAALIALRHDALAAFFAVVFPVLLLVLFPAVLPDNGYAGLPLGVFMVPMMIAYSTAVSGYVNLPAGVAQARECGVLLRLRGSPAPLWTFYAGRVATTALTALVTAVLLVAVGAASAGFRLDADRLPAGVLVMALGVVCWSSLGLALATLVRAGQAVAAVAIGTLLPLSFVSDVFVVGPAGVPAPMRAVAGVFPLRHLAHATLDALVPGRGGPSWPDLAVPVLWTLAGAVVALWPAGWSRPGGTSSPT